LIPLTASGSSLSVVVKPVVYYKQKRIFLYVIILPVSDCLYSYFSIPPILSEKQSTSDRRVARREDAMGHSASVQPTRLTSSAKSNSSRVGVSSNTRVHSLPSLRKERRKDAQTYNAVRQVSDIDRSQMNGVTNTLPSDVKLSPEVIVSISLIFTHISLCIFHVSVLFIPRLLPYLLTADGLCHDFGLRVIFVVGSIWNNGWVIQKRKTRKKMVR